MKIKFLLMLILCSISWFTFGFVEGKKHEKRNNKDYINTEIVSDLDNFIYDVVYEVLEDTVEWDTNYPADFYINHLVEYGVKTKSHRY